MGIKESALSVISSLTNSDYIRAVTSAGASRKIQATNLGKYVVETYSGSTLAGSAQSVKSALNSLQGDITTLIAKLKQSMIVGTASGSVASFNNGSDIFPAIKCVAEINPIQDLNGYDAPWVGGAGKNKLPYGTTTSQNNITYTVASNGVVTLSGSAASAAENIFAIQFTVAESGNYYFSGCADGGNMSTTYDVYLWDVTNSSRAKKWNGSTNSVSITDSSTSEECKLSTGVMYQYRIRVRGGFTPSSQKFYPMVRLSTASDTYEPYENICPISGHTEVKTTRTGKNLIKNTLSSSTLNGVEWTANADGTITANNTATANSTRSFTFNIPAGNYYFNGCPSGGSNTKYDVFIWDNTTGARAKQWDGTTAVVSDFGSNNNNQVQILSGHVYTCNVRVMNGYNAQNIVFKPMIRLASETDGTWEQYNDTTCTTPLGRTVYGGTLDVVSGLLTVTHGIIPSTEQFAFASSYNTDATHKNCIFGYEIGDAKLAPNTNSLVGITCNALEEITFNTALSSGSESYGVYVNDQQATYMIRVAIPKSLGITTVAQANSWLTSIGGLQIAYPLATPQTYQLTPTQVAILLGNNNIYADTGDIDPVEYYADATITIQNLS